MFGKHEFLKSAFKKPFAHKKHIFSLARTESLRDAVKIFQNLYYRAPQGHKIQCLNAHVPDSFTYNVNYLDVNIQQEFTGLLK